MTGKEYDTERLYRTIPHSRSQPRSWPKVRFYAEELWGLQASQTSCVAHNAHVQVKLHLFMRLENMLFHNDRQDVLFTEDLPLPQNKS